MHVSNKTYGHNEGLSVCFRQHLAASHCSLLHGYSLQVGLDFCCDELDARGWVMDFGGLKPVKEWLHKMFDHTVCVAENDPELELFEQLEAEGLIDLRLVPATGCEAFAKLICEHVQEWLNTDPDKRERGVRCCCVEVREHEGNAAYFFPLRET